MIADIFHKIAFEDQPKKTPYYPRPSIAGPERCIRSLVYHALDVLPTPLPGRTLFVFDDGNWHAELVKDSIRKTAFKIHSEEMEVQTPIGKGRIDGVVTDLLGVDRLLEIKAINHFSFERYWKGEYPLDYFTQVSLYMVGVKLVQPEVNEALLLIKNKNTAAFLEFRLSFDGTDLKIIEMVDSNGEVKNPDFTMKDVIKESFNKFSLVEDYKNKKTLPKRPYEVGTTYPCDYCAWAKTCWEGFEKEFESLDKNIDLEEEIAVKAGYYKELSAEETKLKKEKEALRTNILSILSERNATGGRAGEYLINAKLQDREILQRDLIPSDILKRITKISQSVVLYIKKIRRTK